VSRVHQRDTARQRISTGCGGAGQDFGDFIRAGSERAIRSWWSDTLDRTLTPTFELRLERRGKGAETGRWSRRENSSSSGVQACEVVRRIARLAMRESLR